MRALGLALLFAVLLLFVIAVAAYGTTALP
jgi:hypothetical protein